MSSNFALASNEAVKTVTLVEKLQAKAEALRANDLAALFDVTPQHIYKMAARGAIPSFRLAGALRFDPQEVARWLQHKQGVNVQARTSAQAA
jgi:predicted DNA-binding transcriptional regulator AlpA